MYEHIHVIGCEVIDNHETKLYLALNISIIWVENIWIIEEKRYVRQFKYFSNLIALVFVLLIWFVAFVEELKNMLFWFDIMLLFYCFIVKYRLRLQEMCAWNTYRSNECIQWKTTYFLYDDAAVFLIDMHV